MNPVFNEIAKSGLIVPIFANGLSEIKQQISALSKGGIFCAEVHIRSPFFKQTVAQIRAQYPGMLVGVEGIATEEELKEALSAEASFYGVSCLLFLSTVRNREFFIPVCSTEQEVQKVVKKGAVLVQLGGNLKEMKQIFDMYKDVRFILSDVPDISVYASVPQVAAFLLSAEKEDSFYSQTVKNLLGYDLRHIGINCQDAQESDAVAEKFEFLFGFPKEDRGGAYFAGNVIEVMKKQFYGKHGHIAIVTNSAERAAYYLEKKGIKLNWQSAGYNPDGRLRVVYLQEEVGGFALHILQK